MAIEDRALVVPGVRLVATYKKAPAVCTVVDAGDGKIAFTLDGSDKVFSSPSAAGSAVMGGVACNGWRFWSIEGAEPSPKAPSTDSAEEKPKRARKAKAAAPEAEAEPNQEPAESNDPVDLFE